MTCLKSYLFFQFCYSCENFIICFVSCLFCSWQEKGAGKSGNFRIMSLDKMYKSG